MKPNLHEILPPLQFRMTELCKVESETLVASDEGILIHLLRTP